MTNHTSEVPPIPDDFKRCYHCKQILPVSDFNRDKYAKDGLQYKCRTCRSESKKESYQRNKQRVLEKARDYRDANREQIRESQRHIYSSNPEKRESKNLYLREYRDVNAEQIRIKRAKYSEQTAEYRRERDKERYRDNPEHFRIKSANRRARKCDLPDTFTNADWQHALAYFNHACAVCGRPQGLWHTLSADHWIPLSSADCPGTIPTNIVPLCHGQGGCNNGKKDKNADVWLIRRFGKKKAKQISERIQAYFRSI